MTPPILKLPSSHKMITKNSLLKESAPWNVRTRNWKGVGGEQCTPPDTHISKPWFVLTMTQLKILILEAIKRHYVYL